ncbi:hypothetical protein PSV08DRAFT_247262 [Bipolaris maydis]|uniref:uncharacterized protein n=1 Tax=Cochliobolus heterostrophus TaxID=5016 RepID=UPI0024D6AEDB|nr:hypothetical protein J3E73DRAFT_256732 [Bipolaris maydis]KAJ6270570.1 hypothetical protein PSV08DRAFT_247262 [Bipolaris maydis]
MVRVQWYVSTDGDKAIEHGRQKAGLDRGPNSDELLDGMHPSDCLCAILDVQKKRDWASAPQTAPTRQNVIVDLGSAPWQTFVCHVTRLDSTRLHHDRPKTLARVLARWAAAWRELGSNIGLGAQDAISGVELALACARGRVEHKGVRDCGW